jgi:hypothetical protein
MNTFIALIMSSPLLLVAIAAGIVAKDNETEV